MRDIVKAPMSLALLARSALTIAALSLGMPAHAQSDYPSRSIKIVVPVTPGGTADILPRIIGDKLTARWGQPVVIENKPGAGMHLGTEAVLRSEPDGYTLLASPSGPLVVSASLYPKLGFDPSTFVAVTIMAQLPYVLIVNPKLPVKTVPELIAYAKANPDKLNYASPGTGATSQLAMEWIKILTGVRMTHVPYRGSAPAITDLIAGHVDLMIDNLGNSAQYIADGQLRALAVGNEKRLPELPDVPTLAETFPGFVATSWFAIVAPPKTPDAIAAKLSATMSEILHLPDVVSRLHDLGAASGGTTPGETELFLKEETARWRQVIKDADIRAE